MFLQQKKYCFCPHLESSAWLIFPLLAVSSAWTGWRDVWNRFQLTSAGCRIWASLTAIRTQVILVTVVSEVLQPKWLLAYCGLNTSFCLATSWYSAFLLVLLVRSLQAGTGNNNSTFNTDRKLEVLFKPSIRCNTVTAQFLLVISCDSWPIPGPCHHSPSYFLQFET